MNSMIPGFGLIFFSAICGGAFALPLRLRKRFEVENTMLIAFAFATIIIPLISAQIFLPNWTQAITETSFARILLVMALGFGWGIGGVTMAIGVNSIGMSITYATVMGLSTVVGSVIPMLRNWSAIPYEAKLWTFIGIAICVCGVIFCGRAGFMREHGGNNKTETAEEISARTKKTSLFMLGLLSCVASGFLSACANIGFDQAQPIIDKMEALGASPKFATLGGWMAMYWGGYIAMLIVFGSKIVKNKTAKNFTGPGAARDMGLAVGMGLLHYLAQVPYGVGAWFIGPAMGRTVGWAVTIASSLIVANLLGFITGEWKDAHDKSKKVLFTGLAILIMAMTCLAYANSKV